MYLHLGEQYGVTARPRGADGARAADHRRLVHAGAEGDRDLDRRAAPDRGGRRRRLHVGRIAVREQVVGYQRKAIADGSVIDMTPLDLPETSFETEGVWFSPDDRLLGNRHDAHPRLRAPRGEHALISLPPLRDVRPLGHRGLSTNVHEQTGPPTVFVYEGHAGGVGIAERGFDRFADWVADTPGCSSAARAGVPVLRPEPEVRQPERVPRQGGREDLLERMCA